MQANPTTNRRTASRVTPTIRPGDKVRIFDSLHAAYHWHEVSEIITGARPQIKVHGYSTFIPATLVAGHKKGARRHHG
jgi:hypothetical protein